MLTLVNLASERADSIETASSKAQQATNETACLLLERMIKPLLQNTEFEVFHRLIIRVGLLLCDGQLSNVRVVEVMLLANSYVSATFIDNQFCTTLTERRNIINHKICIRNMPRQSHLWATPVCHGFHVLGVIHPTSLTSSITN